MKDEYRADCIVVGAGVVGLAIARQLSLEGKEVVVLERNSLFGAETSSRNSEVIHAGIYYTPNSLKARLCVEGKYALYEYCEKKNIPHRKTAKLIVASSESQLTVLEELIEKAKSNGVEDLTFCSRREVSEMEPYVLAKGALLSPSTGIIDSHQLMLNYIGDIESNDGCIAYNCSVKKMVVERQEIRVFVDDDNDTELLAPIVINSAGLGAINLANNTDGIDHMMLPKQILAKGSYFDYSARDFFSHLIYPVPEPGGLGIHLTLDLSGQAKFGPNVEWIDTVDYTCDENLKVQFLESIRKYFPSIEEQKLHPSYSGVRPKICFDGKEMETDFNITTVEHHGVDGLINLFGIESPGLTASLAIARYVSEQLKSKSQHL